MKFKIIAIVIALSLILSGCIYTSEDIKNVKEEAYDVGYLHGLTDAELLLEEYESDSVYEYSDSEYDIDYIVGGILEEAGSFAVAETDDISLWDAMDIVSIYLDGYDPSGYPLPTKAEFEEAVDVLLRYAMFLEWNTDSFSDVFESFDPFYG